MKSLRFGCLVGLFLILASFLPASGPVAAQEELVASLEVLSPGVEVQRIDTANWVAIKVETLIGEGDKVRTDATGTARITFFEDGTATDLEPDTEYHITTFRGTPQQYQLSVEVLFGITQQQVGHLLDAGSSYEVVTPGARMTVRGTDFALRVEETGRSSVLTSTGLVAASNPTQASDVPPGYGLRAAVDKPLSDVVPATTFAELDAALDGCAGAVQTDADVRLNVRLGPSLTADIVGSVVPSDIHNLIGTTDSKAWYRIPFRDGYGWISAAGMQVGVTYAASCAGLAVYPDNQEEDATRYGLVGDAEVTAIVMVLTANLRAGPSTDTALIGIVGGGDRLTVIGRNEDSTWLKVHTPGDQTGWIATFLVLVNTDLGDVGVVPATVEETPVAPTATPTVTPGPTPTGS